MPRRSKPRKTNQHSKTLKVPHKKRRPRLFYRLMNGLLENIEKLKEKEG